MTVITRTRSLVAALAALPLGLAACGGSSAGNSDLTAGAGGQSSGAPAPVISATTDPSLGAILVDGAGNALYTPDLDAGGMIACLDACTKVWPPLTVAEGVTPMAGSGVSGTLGTVKRPDGTTQVTYDGKTLYTFTVDGGPGQVKGNGAHDSFGGKNFSWSAVTVSGSAPAPAASTSTGGGNPYGNGPVY